MSEFRRISKQLLQMKSVDAWKFYIMGDDMTIKNIVDMQIKSKEAETKIYIDKSICWMTALSIWSKTIEKVSWGGLCDEWFLTHLYNCWRRKH